MKKQYESPRFETIESMQSYCYELNASHSNLGDTDGGGKEDLID